jgi:hypothetical protein
VCGISIHFITYYFCRFQNFLADIAFEKIDQARLTVGDKAVHITAQDFLHVIERQ